MLHELHMTCFISWLQRVMWLKTTYPPGPLKTLGNALSTSTESVLQEIERLFKQELLITTQY